MTKAAIGLFLGLALLTAPPAWAQDMDQDSRLCGSGASASRSADDAIDACTRLIDGGHLSTEHLAAAYYNRAGNNFRKGHFALAVDDYTKAIDLTPYDADDYYNRGTAYDQLAFYAPAIADFTKVISLHPADSNAYDSRCAANDHAGYYDDAIEDCTRAIALNQPFAYNFRAIAYHAKGEDAKALADANKAVTLTPNDADFIATRATIYEQLGRRDEAIADYRAALTLNPDVKSAQGGLKRLGAAP